MTDTSEFKELLNLLDQSEKLVGQFSGGYSDHFYSAQEFHRQLKDSINNLKNGNMDELDKLFLWFCPSYDWDDFTFNDGLELGNKIFDLLLKLNKKNIK